VSNLRPHDGRSESDRPFAQRLSPLIAALGVTAVPNLLLRYQGRLGLTSNEVVYLQHVLMHRWGEVWPWVAIGTIVEATGAAERSVRDWKASVITKGFLTIRTRGRAGGGRGADEHDLSKLFAALEALALEEQIQRAADDARQQLPTPTYFSGMANVPQVGVRGSRKLQTERARPHASKAAENRRINAAENRRANLPEPAAINLPVPAREEEVVNQKPLTEATYEEETGLAAARPDRRAAARLEPSQGEIGINVDHDREDGPGYQDDGICLYIEQWGPELSDDDSQRSVERAHHLWWNSKLPRWRFHNAMKAALHATQAKVEAGRVQGSPMAYFFALLRTTASDECRKEGLPPVNETRDEQRERMALGGIPAEHLELAARLDGLKSDDQVAVEAPAPRRRKERVVA
jgi:hypothetical protein